MRMICAALAAMALTACDVSTDVKTDVSTDGSGGAGGYTLEIRALESTQTYVVTAPDGRTVGARAAEGASALMDETRARALTAEAPPAGGDQPQVFSMRFPGFDLAVHGNDDDADGENGSVDISIAGEQNIIVRADEGGPGDADDMAFVRITGADEETARDFINDAEELSPEVKEQMRAAVGL